MAAPRLRGWAMPVFDSRLAISESPHPLSVHERIDLIDVVRGFALFGVLLANLVWITTDVVLTDARLSQLPTAPLDRIVAPLLVFFVDHKFYTLFSFLFGLGFAIQLSRAEERGSSAVVIYARRVSVLAVIGFLHIALVWYGDILLVYAIAGFGLLAVRHWNTRFLLILALALALFARVAVGVPPLIVRGPDSPHLDAVINENAEKERRLAIFDGISYPAIARENAALYYRDIVTRGVGLVLLPQVFARFILGLYAGRRNWARRTTELRPTLLRLLPWAIGVGVVGNGTAVLIDRLQDRNVLGPDSIWVHAGAPVEEAGTLALAFVYLSALVLLFHRSAIWRRRLGYLAPVGRMALTNYLTQSVLYFVLFTGVGFGLYGEVGPAWCVGLALVIFAAQTAFSGWWLARFRFGPAEWVWRTLTYGRLQPMGEPVSPRTTS
jgi:uncharacterized protein